MSRSVRGDCTVGTFERKNNLPPGTIRNSNGRDTRSDKRIATIRKEYEKSRRRQLIILYTETKKQFSKKIMEGYYGRV